jgi:IS605 OrfB family transposase
MKTFCFKLYKAKRNQKLHKQINAAGLTYNYCIALHKRYYRLYHKSLNVYQLQKHLTKLKKIKRFSYLNEIGSQAVQDITQRIDRAYKLFFDNLKRKVRTAPPSFKKIKKYKSFTLKQTGYKLCDNATMLFFKQNINLVAKANKTLSKKKKGSNNRQRAKLALARLHKKINNQRKEFHWKTAQRIVGEYSLICIEDLNVKAIQRRFGKKISDLGFAEFVNKLKYIAERTGSKVIEINRFYPSSQLCSACGCRNKETKNLNIREWICPSCGVVHQRDKNAAINILREGLRIACSMKTCGRDIDHSGENS